MGFEKRVLDIAEQCGIEDAYFYEGTMFFQADNVTVNSVDLFRSTVTRMFTADVQFSDVGDEVAVDFVAKKQHSVLVDQ